jgi:hypothetical protein
VKTRKPTQKKRIENKPLLQAPPWWEQTSTAIAEVCKSWVAENLTSSNCSSCFFFLESCPGVGFYLIQKSSNKQDFFAWYADGCFGHSISRWWGAWLYHVQP